MVNSYLPGRMPILDGLLDKNADDCRFRISIGHAVID
jgi:hypothetical protein